MLYLNTMKASALKGIIALAVLLGTLVSCESSFVLTVASDRSAILAVESALLPRMRALLGNLSSFSGATAQGNPALLDAAALNAALAKLGGVSSSQLANRSATALGGSIRIADLRTFLATPGTAAAPLFRMEAAADGSARLRVKLDRASSPALVARLSPELQDYLNALMTPIASGEKLSKAEYLETLAMVYGEDLAAELGAAKLTLRVVAPGPVQTVRGGKAAGKFADYQFPLVDLLVLEAPLDLELSWK